LALEAERRELHVGFCALHAVVHRLRRRDMKTVDARMPPMNLCCRDSTRATNAWW